MLFAIVNVDNLRQEKKNKGASHRELNPRLTSFRYDPTSGSKNKISKLDAMLHEKCLINI